MGAAISQPLCVFPIKPLPSVDIFGDYFFKGETCRKMIQAMNTNGHLNAP